MNHKWALLAYFQSSLTFNVQSALKITSLAGMCCVFFKNLLCVYFIVKHILNFLKPRIKKVPSHNLKDSGVQQKRQMGRWWLYHGRMDAWWAARCNHRWNLRIGPSLLSGNSTLPERLLQTKATGCRQLRRRKYTECSRNCKEFSGTGH